MKEFNDKISRLEKEIKEIFWDNEQKVFVDSMPHLKEKAQVQIKPIGEPINFPYPNHSIVLLHAEKLGANAYCKGCGFTYQFYKTN